MNIVEELGSDAFVYGELTNEFGQAAEVHSGAGDAQVIVRVDPRQVPARARRSTSASAPTSSTCSTPARASASRLTHRYDHARGGSGVIPGPPRRLPAGPPRTRTVAPRRPGAQVLRPT